MTVTASSDKSVLARLTQPERAFVLIAFVFGQALVVLIPPFQSADEPYHFYRAFQITEGTFISRQMDVRGFAGGYLPISLYQVWLPFSHMGFHLSEKAPVGELRSAFRIPLNPDQRVFITLPSTAHYSPACYLPQCVGIIAGRIFGAGPLAMLYLARECNLVARVFLGFLAIKWAPGIARPLMLVLLLPMYMYVGSSASADVPTDAFAIAFSAMVLRFCSKEGDAMGVGRFAILWLLSLAVCMCKFAYAPLLGLLLLIPVGRFGGGKQYWFKLAPLVIADIAIMYWWTKQSAGLDVRIRMEGDVSGVRQWQYLLDHPFQFAAILMQTFRTRTWMLFQTYVGVIGWYDLFLPTAFVIGYLVLLLTSCAIPNERAALPSLMRAAPIVLPIVIVSISIIALLSYLYWTPVGATYIDGLHGRYLIPLTPAVLILVCTAFRKLPGVQIIWRPETIDGLIAAASICASAYFLLVVWNRYYG